MLTRTPNKKEEEVKIEIEEKKTEVKKNKYR